MEFVKDAVPWGSAIGLRINTLGSAQIAATGEWYKIGRDQLVPHDGYYDLRITAELWEVYYYDYLALTTVDHPVGTEIFVDERFVIPPLKLGITTVSTPHEIAQAIDDTLNDAFGQRQITQYFTQLKTYFVVLEILPELQKDLSTLDRLYVKSPLTGGAVPLSALVTIDSNGVGAKVVLRKSGL